MFLFGLGNNLQLWGTSLCFTELFVFAATPLLFSSELPYLRRNGLMPFLWISFMVAVGCAIACLFNHTPIPFVIRGLAVTCLLPCVVVVGHWMLRRNMAGFKWYLFGVACSAVLCTFVFQQAVELSMTAGAGKDTADAIMSGPLFWIGRLGAFVTLPAKGWYLQCPLAYNIGAPLFMAGFAMLTSTSGRSAALGAIASVVLVFLGGKKQSKMRRVSKNFWVLFICAFAGAFILKNIYSFAALHDWLGEASRKKYEQQTRGNTSMMALLMGGRMQSFCGLMACVDKPIIGFGPWAQDTAGYQLSFLRKFGNKDDMADYEQAATAREQRGGIVANLIPCHAYITEFWLWYGIWGLVFWLYVIFVLLRFLRQDCWVVPQWFMWLAASVPGYFWGIFFSPFGNRIPTILFVVACLMARAVRKGRQQLPRSMIFEIRKVCL